MAASSPKQLREHLREQQEPFDIHIYILERVMPHHSNQGCKCNMSKRKLYTKNILKMVICKFIRHKCSLEDLNCHKVQNYNLMSKMARKLGLVGEAKRSSAISCSSNHGKPALHLWRKSQSKIHIGYRDEEVAIYTNNLGESAWSRQQASSKGCQIRFSAKGEDHDDKSSSSALQFRTKKLNQAEFMESNKKDNTISSGLQNSEQLLIDITNNATEMHERETYEKCPEDFRVFKKSGNFV